MPRRVTIGDVAREAGVSLQTVSRVLNHKGEINTSTVIRVNQVIQRLGYRPSSIARALATNRTLTVGLVVPDVSNPFFSAIARGAEDTAYDAGYSVLLCNTAEVPEREVAVFQMLEVKRVDGIVVCSSRLATDRLAALILHYPVAVLVNRTLPGPNQVSSVRIDDAAGARLAVNHLLRRGRRTIAFVAGPGSSESGRQRRQGFTAALVDAGLTPDPALTIHCPPNTEGGRTAATHLIAARPDIDAIYCYNDLVAAGALLALATAGRRVPDDVGVVGNDDIALASAVVPALTTLRSSPQEVGHTALHLLLDGIQSDPRGCQDVVFQPELIVRGSAP